MIELRKIIESLTVSNKYMCLFLVSTALGKLHGDYFLFVFIEF